MLSKVTFPDVSYIAYAYDAAHRLVGLEDNQGNRQVFTLDPAGNRIKEETRDTSALLSRQVVRVFDTYARLNRDLGASGELRAEYGYDLQGNVTSVTTPLGAGSKVVVNGYDPLNRLVSVTEPSSISTQFGYNGQSRLVRVTDPRNLTTDFVLDGLGNPTQQTSPDSGSSMSTFDTAGNEITRKDAKGQTTTRQYDALNRLIKNTYPDGSTELYLWDQGAYGKGRLGRIEQRDPASTLTFAVDTIFDAQGRVTRETRTIAGIAYLTQYRYSAGKLIGMTYPSGKKLDYTLNSLGQTITVKLTSGADVTTLSNAISYHPFGGIKQLSNGAGQMLAWSRDLNDRPSTYALEGKNWQVSYDNSSRVSIQQNLNDSAQIGSYSYDSSDRLVQAVLPSVIYGFTYDNVGNRLTQTTGSTTRSYAFSPTSNRLQSISNPARNFTYDANGSIAGDGSVAYVYDSRGRINSVTVGGATTNYLVDPTGSRFRKTGVEDVIFHYDFSGRLIGESDPNGTMRKEYIWLGQQPLAVIQ